MAWKWNGITKSQNSIGLQNNCEKSKNSDVFKGNWAVKFKAYFAFYVAFKNDKTRTFEYFKIQS